MADTFSLSPRVLAWAAAQIGTSLEELAGRISRRNAGKIVAGNITSTEAIKFARTAGVPLGYLFLDAPPAPRQLPIADFRTHPESMPLGRNSLEVFDDIEQKQLWYREQLTTSGAGTLGFVGRFKGTSASADAVAADIRTDLGYVPSQLPPTVRTAEDLFLFLAAKTEAAGVLVFKNSVVANNVKRKLSVSEFRGFCLSDPIAPVVFINGADAPAAWAFTLIHELAHVWKGESGISDATPNSERKEEQFCNSVAAEFLVPRSDFLPAWLSSNETVAVKIENARRRYKVSKLVIALRAIHLGLVDHSIYEHIYGEARQRRSRDESGGDFYRTLAVRNSKKFSAHVASQAVAGAITLREAGRLLNTNPNNITTFHAKQSALSV